MGLNIVKQGSQMYQFINATWNTVKGECPHGCTYCYMKRWGKQKPPRFDRSELKTDLGSGNFIFVGSSCDMFAEDIPEKWILDVLNYCGSFVQNKYLFQTKNPKRILDYDIYFPESVYCTTIETNRYYHQMADAPTPLERAVSMSDINNDGGKCYITIEPIMDFDIIDLVFLIRQCDPIQVNIGADSGNNNLPEPSKEKLLALISELKKFTVIDQKRNLSRLLKS